MKLFVLLLILWTPPTSAVDRFGFRSCGSDQVKAAPQLSCKDELNNDVPWYILYKAPGGQEYSYFSTNGEETTKKLIGASDGILANTLRPMFEVKMPKSFGFLSYSDQPPGKTFGATYGHSKGVVLADSKTKTALWITHSTPKFPFCRNLEDFWPESGDRNGQTFMCVTLKFSQLKTIGAHLQNISANTFKSKIPQSFPREIIDAGDNKGQGPSKPLFQSLKVGDKELLAVAKAKGNTAKDGDLYVQLSDKFQSDMNAKTWCQQGQDKSYCSGKYKVMNIERVQTSLGKWEWTKDHSKWAITADNNKHWTCIADMNRADPQYKRPGGALCIWDEKITNIFRGFVEERLPCRKRPAPCDGRDEMEDLSESLEEMNLNEREDVIMAQSLQQRHIVMKPTVKQV